MDNRLLELAPPAAHAESSKTDITIEIMRKSVLFIIFNPFVDGLCVTADAQKRHTPFLQKGRVPYDTQ
jgi:hypothetical protein